MSSVSVGVRIPSNLYEKLLAHVNKVHASKSEVIISALAQYLESTEDLPLSQRVAEVEKKLAVLESKVEIQ
jgi:metal-responsive CopG/Arc/MetJ family transcriptional regulator